MQCQEWSPSGCHWCAGGAVRGAELPAGLRVHADGVVARPAHAARQRPVPERGRPRHAVQEGVRPPAHGPAAGAEQDAHALHPCAALRCAPHSGAAHCAAVREAGAMLPVQARVTETRSARSVRRGAGLAGAAAGASAAQRALRGSMSAFVSNGARGGCPTLPYARHRTRRSSCSSSRSARCCGSQ